MIFFSWHNIVAMSLGGHHMELPYLACVYHVVAQLPKFLKEIEEASERGIEYPWKAHHS